MAITKKEIEKSLSRKEPDYKVIYSPKLQSNFHGVCTTVYRDGTKVIADYDHKNKQILWNDYYLAESLYLADKIKSAHERLMETIPKVKHYPHTEGVE